jgi:trigger factor
MHPTQTHQRTTVNVTTEKLNDANVLAKATLLQSDIDVRIDKLARQMSKQVTIDGFRPGKVPPHVVKKLYGNQLAEDAEGEALRDMITAAYTEAGIQPHDVLGDPIFKKYEKEDEGIAIEMQLCLRPTVESDHYTDVIPAFERPEVSEEEIDERIAILAKEVAPLEPLKTKRPLEKGDVAVLDFEGFIDGVAFEGGRARKYELEIGSETFIPGFETGIEGMEIGEEKRIPVEFPQDYPSEELKGKAAEFVVKLHEIKIKSEPEINDDLAKQITRDDTATVQSMREGIEAQLRNEKISKFYNEEIKPKLVEALVEHFEFDLPENIVEQEIDNLVNQKAQTMSREEIEAVQKDSAKLEALREEVREEATRSVKATFIVDALAKKEGVSVSDTEVIQTLQYEAIVTGQNPDELVQYYEKNNLLPAVKMSLLEDKLYAKLLGLDAQ